MRKILIVSLLIVCLPVAALAGGGEFTQFWSANDVCSSDGAGSTYIGLDGAVRMAGMVPRIDIANVTSDLATSTLGIYTENGDSTTVDASSASGQKVLFVTATTSFEDDTAGAGSVVAIVDTSEQEFEINRVSSITAGADLCMVEELENTYDTSTTVYELTSTGGPLVGNTTKDWDSIALRGEAGSSLGLVLTGTSACGINFVGGGYDRE